jgi:hypothetical protein
MLHIAVKFNCNFAFFEEYIKQNGMLPDCSKFGVMILKVSSWKRRLKLQIQMCRYHNPIIFVKNFMVGEEFLTYVDMSFL